jgi:hypothetical protein
MTTVSGQIFDDGVNNFSPHLGYLLYGCHHRVGRVLSFSLVVGIGTPPTPHPQASVPPTFGSGGIGAHSLAREGVGESQFRRGDIHSGIL